MKSSVANLIKGIAIIVIGTAICAVGIYIGDTGDAPGVSLVAILLMIGSVLLGIKIARRKA